MPTKLFYINKNDNEQINKKHKTIYNQEMSKLEGKLDKPEDSSVHDELINMIFEKNPEAREARGSLKSSQFNKPQSGNLLVEIETDDNNNIVQIKSQFGETLASSLNNKAKSGVDKLLGLNANNNNNQVEEPSPVFFHKCKDGLTNEDLHVYKTHYGDNSYSLTIDNYGHQIYAKQDTENFQRYNRIQPQDVPQEVKNSFEEYFEDKISKISKALSNDDLWKKNGKDISSVPKKLLRIINNNNYSPSEKYNRLVQEATHQQQQKRGKFGSFFKGGQRPEQVNELLRNITEQKDVNIEKLPKLATTSSNNNSNNNNSSKQTYKEAYQKVKENSDPDIYQQAEKIDQNTSLNPSTITNSML